MLFASSSDGNEIDEVRLWGSCVNVNEYWIYLRSGGSAEADPIYCQTLSTNQIPSHTHNLNHNHPFGSSTSNDGAHTHSYTSANYPTSSGPEQNQSGGPEDRTTFNVAKTTGSSGGHAHNFTGTTSAFNGASQPTGSGDPIDNRPPYYALCYIMKT